MKKRMIAKRIIEVTRDKKTNTINFVMELAHVPENCKKIAIELDGDAYTESCFAFQYKFKIGANRYFIDSENGKEMYYLDEEGTRHYMDVKIPQNVINIATDKCNERLKKMGIKKQRKSRVQKQTAPVENATNTIVHFVCMYRKELFESGNKRLVPGQLALF